MNQESTKPDAPVAATSLRGHSTSAARVLAAALMVALIEAAIRAEVRRMKSPSTAKH